MFALRPAQRIAVVVQRTGLAAGRSAAYVRDDVVPEECLRWEERYTVVGWKCGPGRTSNPQRCTVLPNASTLRGQHHHEHKRRCDPRPDQSFVQLQRYAELDEGQTCIQKRL